MKVAMKNPTGGQLKEIKVGWSWTIFFFAWFFGVPLFLRGLYGWGIAMVALLGLMEPLADMAIKSPDLAVLLHLASLVEFGLIIYLSATGNGKSAKARLKRGWTFLDPESDAVKYAKGKWGIL